MDIVNVNVKEMRRKKKKAPGSRRRFVMKYTVIFVVREFKILYGMSVSIDATASQDG
jgi:hypothetical protein